MLHSSLYPTSSTGSNNQPLPEGWDRYRKVRELGQGSYGTVYLCIDTTIPEPSLEQDNDDNHAVDYFVAVKCVSLSGASESESSNALREVAILRNLDHPNVLRMLDCFIDRHEHLCTVTEYIDGGDLSDMIEKCNSVNNNNNTDKKKDGTSSKGGYENFSYESEGASTSEPSYRADKNGNTDNMNKRFYVDAIAIVDIAEQILKGLSYIHQSRIVHHDMKPANIFITSNGCIKIGDFGVARIINHSHQQTKSLSTNHSTGSSVNRTMLGTPFYLSPEGLLGSKTSFPADIWAFGVLMYELYCGVVPFAARNVLALVNIITQGKYDQDRLACRPYRSGLENNSGQQLSATENAGGVSAQVQQEVCDAVCNIIKTALVLDPTERPSARQLLLKFFTEDASAPTNPEVELFTDPTIIQPSARGRGDIDEFSSARGTVGGGSSAGLSSQQQQTHNNRYPTVSTTDNTLESSNSLLSKTNNSTFFVDESESPEVRRRRIAQMQQEEVQSVVRSSTGYFEQQQQRRSSQSSSSQPQPHQMTTSNSLSAVHSSTDNGRSLLAAQTEILDVPDEGDQTQGYDDDFEDDILSSSIMKKNVKDKTKEFINDNNEDTFRLSPTATGRNNDENSRLGETRAIEEKVNALPWVVEAEVFEGIKLDDVAGHGPLFIVKENNNNGEEGSSSSSINSNKNHHPSARRGSVASIPDPKPHHLNRPTSAQSNSSQGQGHHQNQQQQGLGFLQQHRGQHSDLVCEMATPSRIKIMNMLNNNNNKNHGDADATSSFSLNTNVDQLSLHSYRDPSSQASSSPQTSLGTAGGGGGALPINNNNNTNNNNPQQELKSKEEYYEDMQKRIRERAVIFHKKRLDALAKERAQLRAQQSLNNAEAQRVNNNGENDNHNFSVPINVPPLGAFSKPQQLDPNAVLERNKSLALPASARQQTGPSQPSGQEPEQSNRRASHLLNEIVDSRARGIVSNALLSAFPHILHQQRQQSARNSVVAAVASSARGNAPQNQQQQQQPQGKITKASEKRIAARNNNNHNQNSTSSKRSKTTTTASSGHGEFDDSSESISSDDDDEEDEITDDDDDEEEEEEEEDEEESEIDDDEFRVKVLFSAETARILKAVPFDSSTFAVNSSLPKEFPAFSLRFHLFSDDGYSKLLKSIQDKVVFFAEAEKMLMMGEPSSSGDINNNFSESDLLKTIAGSMTSKKKKKKLLSGTAGNNNNNASSLAKSATAVLSQVVPLSFEYADRADKIVFDRRADWSCVREMHLDKKGMDSVMTLTAIPRK